MIAGEPKGFCLDHFSPPNGKGQTLASHIHNAIKGTEFEQKLIFVGSNGISSMTGHINGLLLLWKDC